jgi:signal transduction histidine kinase
VAVEVTDNGATRPAADLPGLFEPHFEGPVAGRGNGMEYSICRDIALRHKGTIRAISKSDFGTIIRVTFPTEDKHGAGQHSGD